MRDSPEQTPTQDRSGRSGCVSVLHATGVRHQPLRSLEKTTALLNGLAYKQGPTQEVWVSQTWGVQTRECAS